MERLKNVIAQYGRWSPLNDYIERIEAYKTTDFSLALENAKALLETIGKEICNCKGIEPEQTITINSVLKKAFTAIGYQNDDVVTQISSALATIGQKIGELRNTIGPTAHGRQLEDLKTRNEKVDGFTQNFLIDVTSIIACFLISAFETEHPREHPPQESKILYAENEEFNDYWDETYGEFTMGEYSYTVSEILYNVDYRAYISELKTYTETKEEDQCPK